MKHTCTIFGSRSALGDVAALAVMLATGGVLSASAQTNVVRWGQPTAWDYPAYATNVVAIDGGGGYSALGLRQDGTVFRWKKTYESDDAAIAGCTNVVAVIAYPGNSLGDEYFAVRSSGSVAINGGWQDGFFNRTNDFLWPSYAVNGSAFAARGLAADGSVRSGDYFYRNPQRETTRLSNVVSVVGFYGPSHWPEVSFFRGQVALKPDGSLAYPVQTTSGLITYGEIPILSASNIVALASEENHVLALREDGTVFSWGFNFYGTTNVPPGLSNVIAIAASRYTSMALKSDGTVVMWGDNSRGQSNVPAGLTNVMAIGCNQEQSYALLAQGKPFLTGPLPERVGLAGGKVYFRMQASGQWPLSYQWRHYGTNLPGETNMVLKLTSLDTSHAGPYSVVVSNALGSATSREAQLSLAPFFIQLDPQTENIGIGGSANLSAQVQSQYPLNYQWRFNGVDIPGATNGTLSLEDATFEMTGNYSLVISNSFGVATSAVARVAVRQFVEWGYVYGTMASAFQRLVDATNALCVNFGDANGIAGVLVTDEGALQIAPGLPSLLPLLSPPAGLTNVLDALVADDLVGSSVGTALRQDGSVVEWGDPSILPTRSYFVGLSNVVAIFESFGGYGGPFAVQADGNLVTPIPPATNSVNLISIASELGVRGDGSVALLYPAVYSSSRIPAGLTNLVAVSRAGHSLGLRRDGTVTAWDRDEDDDYGETLVPAGLSNVVEVLAGYDESFALRRDGTLAFWGGNPYYSTNIPRSAKDLVRLALASSDTYRVGVIGYGPPKVLAHAGHFSGVVGGQTLFQCKAAGKPPLYYQWRKDGVNLPGETNAMLVLRNTTTADNGVYSAEVRNALGTNVAGAAQLTIQAATFPQPPIPQQAFRGGSLTLSPQIYGSGTHSYQWLFNGAVIAGATNATLQLADFDPTQAGQYSLRVSNEFGIAESPATSVGLMNVAAWGSYEPGASGFGIKPIFIPIGLADAVQVAAGKDHALALRRNATVLPWGSDDEGQASVPSGLTNVVAVAAGTDHSLALLRSGHVVGWGNNSYGQTNPPSNLTNAIAIAAAGNISAALRNDGTITVWGTGSPVPPPDLTNVTAIAVGGHGLALRQNRTVAAWGSNASGQTNVPATLTNVIAIAAGDSHYLALRSDGTVVAWGNNSYGQTNVPPGLSNVIAIAAGAGHSLALLADRTVVGWGSHYGGQTNPPVGLSNAVAIAAGGIMSLALVGAPDIDRAQLGLHLTGGLPGVHVTGPPGQIVAIQSSSNLVNWVTVAQQTNYTGHWLWQDETAGGKGAGFYRAVANAKTAPPFALTGTEVSGDGTIRFTVHGPPGCNFRIEASTNLLHWTPVVGFKSIGETPVSLLPRAAGVSRFYRVIAP